MKPSPEIATPARKVYNKPTWQKQEIFERFSLACGGKVKLTAQNCHQIGS